MKKFIEILFFLRIVISPLTLGLIIGFLTYKILGESNRGAFLFGIFSLLGLIAGIFWAIKVSEKRKPSEFMSKVNASPDIDEAVKK